MHILVLFCIIAASDEDFKLDFLSALIFSTIGHDYTDLQTDENKGWMNGTVLDSLESLAQKFNKKMGLSYDVFTNGVASYSGCTTGVASFNRLDALGPHVFSEKIGADPSGFGQSFLSKENFKSAKTKYFGKNGSNDLHGLGNTVGDDSSGS